MAQIKNFDVPPGMFDDVEKFAPGWKIANCGPDMNPGLRTEWGGRPNVLVTHPLDLETPCILSRSLEVPAGKKTILRLTVGHDPQGDFDLIVKVNGKGVVHKPVSKATAANDPWLTEEIDLSANAGKTVKLELINQPSGWTFEAAYWAEIAVASQ